MAPSQGRSGVIGKHLKGKHNFVKLIILLSNANLSRKITIGTLKLAVHMLFITEIDNFEVRDSLLFL
jgi:hypothetical protein